MKKIFFFLILGILLTSFITASCTITLDKESYFAGETVTAKMSCSTGPEKSKPYTLNWTNQSGYQFEIDSGTTPSVAGTLFYQTYTIPSNWPNGIFVNASLNGTGLSVIQNASANVTSTASANSLIITNASFGGGYLGLVGSVKATVKDENGKKISGGFCKVSAWSNDELSVLLYQDTVMVDGEIKVSDIMPTTRFNEGIDYAYKILCYCGSTGSETECIDQDGVAIVNSIGTTKNFFKTSTWLNSNTFVDKSIYHLKDEIFVCANVTNINYTYRIPLHIFYQIRCSKDTDNPQDLDRILLNYNSHDDPEPRGISPNTSQMQCIKFIIPEEEFLMGSNSECYASTDVWVLDNSHNELIDYSTTSSIFYINSDEINLEADWQWVSSNRINSIINLSNFENTNVNINGSGIGNVDIRLNFGNALNINNIFDFANIISSITITNTTSTLVEHTDYEVEFLEYGYIELEMRNVNLSDSWFNISIDFYNLNLRQTEALEGIESKTGTFHLDVDCPPTGNLGSSMDCIITAYIEDSQLVQKEVDFTCYIFDGTSEYSASNFNQMITKKSTSITRSFTVPSTFNSGQQYVLQCHADYYNLGSRRDSFYDTFFTSSGGGSPSITGGVVGGEREEGEKEKKEGEEGIGEKIINIIKKFNPLSPERNWAFIFAGGVILIGIIILIGLYIKKRKKKYNYQKSEKKFNQEVFKKVLLILAGVVILISIIAGIIFIINYLSNLPVSEQNSVIPENYSMIHDKLFRGMILALFILIMIIIFFKVLNVRGEVKFGIESVFRKYDKKMRIQRKLNREMLKHELRSMRKK